MKLLILSDSHGNVSAMRVAVEKEHPDGIVHLGDHWRDASDLSAMYPQIPMYRVAGNCDSYSWEPGRDEILVRKFENVIVYMTHGHQHGVKMSLLRLHLAAQEAGARVALFGHTHRAFADEKDGLTLINPGSCGSRTGTYAIMDIHGEDFSWEIRKFPVDHKEE